MAVDGDSSTRWSSGQWMQNTSTGWIYVDLGAPYNVSEVRLNWETAYAVNYQIQVSYDGVNWVAIKTVSGNQSKGPVDFSELSGAGRFVRIYCTQTSTGSDNYSLYDFQVLGTPIIDLAQGRPTYASTVESSYFTPNEAVDGNSSTRWSSGQWTQNTNTGWIYVDLGALFNVNEVRLNWERAYAVDYQIQVSSDGSNWVTIDTITGNQSRGIADFTDLSGVGRFVRIYCTETSTGSDNYSLYDFQVFGNPANPLNLQPAGTLTMLVSTPPNGATAVTETSQASLPPLNVSAPMIDLATMNHRIPPTAGAAISRFHLAHYQASRRGRDFLLPGSHLHDQSREFARAAARLRNESSIGDAKKTR
jgi:hypothetical protein